MKPKKPKRLTCCGRKHGFIHACSRIVGTKMTEVLVVEVYAPNRVGPMRLKDGVTVKIPLCRTHRGLDE